MSDRKLEEIESMFKKTAQPKLEIDEIVPIKKIGVIMDKTAQGKIALDIATSLSEKLEISLDIVVAGEYSDIIQKQINVMNEEVTSLFSEAQEKVDEKGVYAKTLVILSAKVEKTKEIFEQETQDEEKLSSRLVMALEESADDIVVLGVPLFREDEEEKDNIEEFGFYITKLLRERRIHSNFLLITQDVEPEINDQILGFVTFEQQAGSILALTKRALSLANENSDITLLGMVTQKTVETVARANLEIEDTITSETGEETTPELDLKATSDNLETKMADLLDSIRINEDIPHKSFKSHVRDGSISTMVNTALEEFKPGLVLVRSVAEIVENLDPVAEQITRLVLRAGIPVLIVWD